MDTKIMDILSQYMAECAADPKDAEKVVPEGPGTYVCVKFAPETIRNLEIYQAYLAQALDIHPDDLLDPEEFHTTVVYSRVPVDNYKTKTFDPPLEVKVKRKTYKLALFGKDKDTLVLTYKSRDLQDRFDYSRKLGATTDYPDYCPHITFAYKVPGRVAKRGSKLLRELHLPTFPILITKEEKSVLDDDWSDKAKTKGKKADLSSKDRKEESSFDADLASEIGYDNPLLDDLPFGLRVHAYFHSIVDDGEEVVTAGDDSDWGAASQSEGAWDSFTEDDWAEAAE